MPHRADLTSDLVELALGANGRTKKLQPALRHRCPDAGSFEAKIKLPQTLLSWAVRDGRFSRSAAGVRRSYQRRRLGQRNFTCQHSKFHRVYLLLAKNYLSNFDRTTYSVQSFVETSLQFFWPMMKFAPRSVSPPNQIEEARKCLRGCYPARKIPHRST